MKKSVKITIIISVFVILAVAGLVFYQKDKLNKLIKNKPSKDDDDKNEKNTGLNPPDYVRNELLHASFPLEYDKKHEKILSRGIEVKKLQEYLNAMSYDRKGNESKFIDTDGVYGDDTYTALMSLGLSSKITFDMYKNIILAGLKRLEEKYNRKFTK